MTRFEQSLGEPYRRPGRDETSIEVVSEVDAFLRGGQGSVQIAEGHRDHGAIEEVPRESLDVARQSLRQIIESINDTLNGELNFETHGCRTTSGVLVRVWQHLLAPPP